MFEKCLKLYKILLTPIRKTSVKSASEKRFNQALTKTRVSVEHCFGMLKKRYLSLELKMYMFKLKIYIFRFPALLYTLRARKFQNIYNIIGKALYPIILSIVLF